MSNILAIDTSSRFCSVALITDGLIFSHVSKKIKNYTSYVLPMIDNILLESKIGIKDLHALAICKGPGSFTGIRIAIGIAQGFSLGFNFSIIDLSSLLVLAEKAWKKTRIKNILSMIYGGVGKVYFAKYEKNQLGNWLTQENESLLTTESLRKILRNMKGQWAIAGNFPARENFFEKNNRSDLLLSNVVEIEAKDMIPLAEEHFKSGKFTALERIIPNYLDNFSKEFDQ